MPPSFTTPGSKEVCRLLEKDGLASLLFWIRRGLLPWNGAGPRETASWLARGKGQMWLSSKFLQPEKHQGMCSLLWWLFSESKMFLPLGGHWGSEAKGQRGFPGSMLGHRKKKNITVHHSAFWDPVRLLLYSTEWKDTKQSNPPLRGQEERKSFWGSLFTQTHWVYAAHGTGATFSAAIGRHRGGEKQSVALTPPLCKLGQARTCWCASRPAPEVHAEAASPGLSFPL